MRMPPDQLAVQLVEHVGDGEMPFVRRQLGIEQNLQQQVAKLFGQMREVTLLDRVEDLVGLFERVLADGVEGLLAIPWAPARRTQTRHDPRRLLKKPAGAGCVSGLGHPFLLG